MQTVLFSSASGLTNALKLARLLFSLPVSNGKLERVFSTMKNIKQEKWSSMNNNLQPGPTYQLVLRIRIYTLTVWCSEDTALLTGSLIVEALSSGSSPKHTDAA